MSVLTHDLGCLTERWQLPLINFQINLVIKIVAVFVLVAYLHFVYAVFASIIITVDAVVVVDSVVKI